VTYPGLLDKPDFLGLSEDGLLRRVLLDAIGLLLGDLFRGLGGVILLPLLAVGQDLVSLGFDRFLVHGVDFALYELQEFVVFAHWGTSL